MPKKLFEVDVNKKADDQKLKPHNRWHPEIPAVASVEQGDVFRVECLDWTDGQISNNDDPSDIDKVDLNRVHVLSGPFHINGAEPGDLLVVDILDIGTLPDSEWGFTGIFSRENGGGFLTDHFPEAQKACWDFHGIYARSRHIPNVEYAGITHPGLIGTAPSQELLDEWNRRENELLSTDPHRVPPLVAPQGPTSAILGELKKGPTWDKVAKEGARTVPPRENGGNCDIKNLSRGSRVFFPVFVEGANLSLGDLHFSQGDGEITFCGAIEMAGWADLRCYVIKGGMEKYNIKNNPMFMPGPVEPRYSEFLVFEGVSVSEDGKQHYLDPFIAYQRACLNAIDYLKTLGYTGQQAYFILGTAPVEGRISGIVDIPNACCTIYVPKEIFKFDVLPKLDN